MENLIIEITPSTIKKVIKRSQNLKNAGEVIALFEQLVGGNINDEVENESDEDLDDADSLISDNIPESLKPFADALFGAISTTTED
jgi:hypothetical protein